MLQHAQRVEEQVAAVGPVKGAGFDQGEVADQRAELRLVLDAPHQVSEGGVVFVDDRRARLLAVVHQQVDLVAAKARVAVVLERPLHRRFEALRRPLEELVGAGDDVALHLVEVVEHLGVARAVPPHGLEPPAGHRGRQLPVERLQRFLVLAPPLAELPQQVHQLPAHLLQFDGEPFPLLLGQLAELLRVERLAVVQRGQHQARFPPHHRHVVRFGLLLDLGDGGVLLVLEAVHQLVPAAAVLLALEGHAQGQAQLGHRPGHALLQACPHARGEARACADARGWRSRARSTSRRASSRRWPGDRATGAAGSASPPPAAPPRRG